MSDNLKDLLKEVAIPGILAIMLTGTSCYLAIVGRPLPEWLYTLVGVAVSGFFTYATASRIHRK